MVYQVIGVVVHAKVTYGTDEDLILVEVDAVDTVSEALPPIGGVT